MSDLLEAKTALRVEARPLDAAAAILGQRWPVATNSTWLSVQATRDEIPVIVRTLVGNNIDIFQVTGQRQTLEEYFLSVVSEEAPHG